MFHIMVYTLHFMTRISHQAMMRHNINVKHPKYLSTKLLWMLDISSAEFLGNY